MTDRDPTLKPVALLADMTRYHASLRRGTEGLAFVPGRPPNDVEQVRVRFPAVEVEVLASDLRFLELELAREIDGIRSTRRDRALQSIRERRKGGAAQRLDRDRYLVDDEVRRLLYAARTRPHVNAQRDHAFLSVVAGAGLRCVEALGIRVGDLARIEDRPASLTVRTAKRRGGAVIEDVDVEPGVALTLLKFLRTIPATERTPHRRVFPMTPRQARRVFKRYAEIAGLNPKYKIHGLRHYRGTKVYAETGDLMLTKAALRHSAIASTQIYVHLVDRAKRLAEIRLPEESNNDAGTSSNGAKD